MTGCPARAFVQATLRSIRTGKSSDVRFSSTEKIEVVPMVTRKMEFSYKDGDDYVFSDPENYETVTLSPQDGLDRQPCTPGWPKKIKGEYAEHWHGEHELKPGTQTALESTTFYAPPGYDEDREHLWNFFESVRTRRPSVEDATFGNNTAIACHMANYSYFHKTTAVWDAAAKMIKG